MKMNPRKTPIYNRYRGCDSSQNGFTLIEMIVTLMVLSIVIVMTLNLFDVNTRLSQVQTTISELQQTHRVGHSALLKDLRMAGRGSLDMRTFPMGEALWVQNNVPDSTFIDDLDTYPVLPGTDIITVRGVLSTPVYTVVNAPLSFNTVSNTGQITVANTVRSGLEINQSLQPLVDAITNNRAEKIIMVSQNGDQFHVVVTLDPGASAIGVDTVTIAFGNPDRAWDSGHFSSFSRLGIIEEYRYYISDTTLVDGDANSSFRPRLMRAKLDPFTATLADKGDPYLADTDNWHLEVADGIVGLQAAFGVDIPPGAGLLGDGQIVDNKDETDEWLYNHASDDDTVNWDNNTLFFLRVNTIAIAERPDSRYEARLMGDLEDFSYVDVADDPLNGDGRREYRRRVLKTVIDLRNL